MSADDYPQNSAHHGMAMNAGETKLCVAGTIDDYAAIVSRPGLTTDGFVYYAADSLPYWAQTSNDGQKCFVSLAEKDSNVFAIEVDGQVVGTCNLRDIDPVNRRAELGISLAEIRAGLKRPPRSERPVFGIVRQGSRQG